jgi:hypothetical protein
MSTAAKTDVVSTSRLTNVRQLSKNPSNLLQTACRTAAAHQETAARKLMSFRRDFLFSTMAIAGLAASLNANAEKCLYYHWDAFGSSGEPGGITYMQVVDGWYDDGTGGTPADRFPNSGKRGSGASHMSKDGKIDGPKSPGKGCTVPRNLSGVKGLPAGTKTWPIFISPLLDATNQAGFRQAVASVNDDQKQRGRTFRLTEVPTAEQARVFITDNKPGVFTTVPGNDAVTDTRYERNGDIARSWTVADPTSDLDYATVRARHEIGHMVGLDDVPTFDSNYPSVMVAGIGEKNKKQGLDSCTAAAIDANVNRSK